MSTGIINTKTVTALTLEKLTAQIALATLDGYEPDSSSGIFQSNGSYCRTMVQGSAINLSGKAYVLHDVTDVVAGVTQNNNFYSSFGAQVADAGWDITPYNTFNWIGTSTQESGDYTNAYLWAQNSRDGVDAGAEAAYGGIYVQTGTESWSAYFAAYKDGFGSQLWHQYWDSATTANNCHAYVSAIAGASGSFVNLFGGTIRCYIGNLNLMTVGQGINIAEGANARAGLARLSGGTVVVATNKVTATSRIRLTPQDGGSGTAGWVRVSARTNGTSFTITSSSGSDAHDVEWEIREPA
jgi:hypothetical protein